MTLRAKLEALVNAAPAGTMVPVSSLAEWIAAESDVPSTLPDGNRTGATIDLSVAELARQYGRCASTIRTWCEQDLLPGAYKLRGKEWRIPASAVESMQRTAREQHAASGPTKAAAPEAPASPDIGAWREHLPSRRHA